MSPNNPQSSPNERIGAKDELLQVMYWLQGEKLAQDVTSEDLARWVSLDSMEIHSLLVDLAESKLVEPLTDQTSEIGAMRFRLTGPGVKEGGRRFADEFSDLTKPGHYECSDPDCDCRRTGNPADCVHQH